VSGLEVKMKDTETWVAANKVEGCLLVNLGDLMAHWSNDMYVSTWHRVLSHASETRYSVPYFCNCDFDAEVECITTLTPGQEAKYGKVTAGRYIMDKLGLMFE
jgi:isopenicillin N synthase-like dioxygenase